MSENIVLTFTVKSKLEALALIEAYGEIIHGDGPATMTTPPAAQVAAATAAGTNVPAAPTMNAPTMSPAPTAEAANRDNTGVPFNAAIHAPSGRLSAKGEWTLKKGVDKAAAEAWKREHATGTVMRATAPAPVPTPAELNAKFGAPAWPAVPAALPVHFPPVPYNTFGALYAKLAHEGKITGADVTAFMAETGVTDPQTYVTDDAKRAHAFALLQKFDV